MPELPEVETVARQLAPCLVGRRVRSLRIYDDRLRDGPPPRVAGRKIVTVSRSGKQVLIGLAPREAGGGSLWLSVHLRMTGRLLWVDDRMAASREHLRAKLRLDRGTLLFVDTRRFGTMRWSDRIELTHPAGTDPLDPALSPRGLGAMLHGSRQNIKAWLLRQDRLVGLGNIYASEILHAAGISPRREAGSLGPAEVARLLRSTRRILGRAIRDCGTTFSDFQDARGVEGSYQHRLAVYARDGRPCRRCRATIERIVQQQRSSFFCPRCQR